MRPDTPDFVSQARRSSGCTRIAHRPFFRHLATLEARIKLTDKEEDNEDDDDFEEELRSLIPVIA